MFQLLKGKYHGTVDIGLAVLTYKKTRKMIDIDADDLIYHLKVLSSARIVLSPTLSFRCQIDVSGDLVYSPIYCYPI